MDTPLLSLENVTKTFGGVKAVNNMSFEVADGSVIGIIGPNGAGKTTVFNLITGNYVPDGGDIRFQDHSIIKLKPHEIVEHGIARTFQSIRLFANLPAIENVLSGLHCRMQSGLFPLFSVFAVSRKKNSLPLTALCRSWNL